MGSTGPKHDYDVIIIGAGLSGVCSLYHIKQRFPDWRVKVFDAASGPGGVWYWNCYPGARVDSESMSYCYSFDKELLDEWHWKESFSSQPEVLRYLNRVCEKHDLYKDMLFDTRIQSATWQDNDHTWLFRDDKGVEYRTTFFVSCVGFLSAPTWPAIPGREDFAGESFHTSRWPKDLDKDTYFANKRVGVIGTGATGIQTITQVSKAPGLTSLTVFQRTANWSAPLRNEPITKDQMEELKKTYTDLFQRCLETPTGFIHKPDPRRSLDVSAEERLAHWEKIYADPGMSKWVGAFSDTYTDREANRLYSAFMADKIRARVDDPVVAERLVPWAHGFGTRRVPLESGYFEAYNRPNVHLVDLQETPVERITAVGVLTADGTEHALDVLVFATGFDAITGAYAGIDWKARGGRPLVGRGGGEGAPDPIWRGSRPRAFLGMTVPSVPNMVMVMGPHQPFGNAPRNIEHAVEVAVDLLAFCRGKGYTWFEPTEEATDEWTEHVYECSRGALANEVDSWMTGVNGNVDGKEVRMVARYAGSAVEYRRRCEACRASGWEGLMFGRRS